MEPQQAGNPRQHDLWWRRGGSNSRPSHCERDALPAELRPREQARILAATLWTTGLRALSVNLRTPATCRLAWRTRCRSPIPPGSTSQYNNRARIPEHPQIFARWAESSKLARERLNGKLDVALRRPSRRDARRLPGRPGRRAGAGVHPWRLLASARQGRSFVPRARVRRVGRDGGGAQLRAVPSGDHRDHRAADDPGAGLGLAQRGCTPAIPTASPWSATRPAVTWPR